MEFATAVAHLFDVWRLRSWRSDAAGAPDASLTSATKALSGQASCRALRSSDVASIDTTKFEFASTRKAEGSSNDHVSYRVRKPCHTREKLPQQTWMAERRNQWQN
jgi:hypothetical protein